MGDESDAPPNGASQEVLPRLRLAEALRERFDWEGSYAKLEQAIRRAISSGGSVGTPSDGEPRFVDRRKLKQIVDNHPKLVLTIGELRALDRYLEPYGHGLAFNPLFEKPEVLRSLAESGRVAFLLGSKTDENEPLRVNVSHWDLLGLSRIQAGILGLSHNVHIDIREARMHKEQASARAALGRPERKSLFAETGPSLVCLGSSLGNQMAESMLCHMAGLEVFDREADARRLDLPFHFVWSKQRSYVLPSAFHLYGENTRLENAAAGDAVLKRKAACFRYGRHYLIDELSTDGKSDGFTYALCAVQRRPQGQIWLLVAGLTGPATFAAAKWVNEMAAGLYDRKGSRPSPVYWSLLRAHAVRGDGGDRGDEATHQVEDAEVIHSDAAWG